MSIPAGRIANRAVVCVNQTTARVNRAVGKVNVAGRIVNRTVRIVFPAGEIVNRTVHNVIRSVHIVFNNRASVIPQTAHHKPRPAHKSPAPQDYYSKHCAFRFVNWLGLSLMFTMQKLLMVVDELRNLNGFLIFPCV